MKRITLVIIAIFFSFQHISESLDIAEIKKKEIPNPSYRIELNSPSNICAYESPSTFPFQSNAKNACEKKLAILKEYGVSVIGCNLIEKENEYSFTLEYLCELKNPALINSVIIKEYRSPKTYWSENLAEEEMKKTYKRFQSSKLIPLEKIVEENNNGYSFKIRYIVNNLLKKSQKYYVNIENTKYGRYIFESDANNNINSVISLFKKAGVCAFDAVVENEVDYYTIKVVYINKSDTIAAPLAINPEYSIENYTSSEGFPFEDTALNEGLKRNQVFEKAFLTPIHNYSVNINNDSWTFSTDYVVKNIYKNGVFIKKEYVIKRYINPTTFDFESDAESVMRDKISNFNSAGLYVISSKVYEISGNYSFLIDYIEKNQ